MLVLPTFAYGRRLLLTFGAVLQGWASDGAGRPRTPPLSSHLRKGWFWREVARGRAVGLRRIRVFADGAVPDAAALRAEATAFAGAEVPVLRVAAYRADPAVLRAVLAAAGSSGETDTANWMTGQR